MDRRYRDTNGEKGLTRHGPKKLEEGEAGHTKLTHKGEGLRGTGARLGGKPKTRKNLRNTQQFNLT